MKIIIPMAGIGKRMRPHTLTLPKPLFPIAGKSMVEHIIDLIASSTQEKIEEIAFVIGNFGKEIESQLVKIAEKKGATGKIYYQQEALGTAHAILCANASLKGKTVVVFADTLFRGNITIREDVDGIIWVKKVEDPSPFGVVKTDKKKIITAFVEKSPIFVSDLAIIGLYYFKSGEILRNEIKFLIDNNIRDKGEYQLTNALENMKKKGARFYAGEIDEWLDCGNKDNTLQTHKRVLEIDRSLSNMPGKMDKESHIIAPCHFEKGVLLKRSTIGPFVSIGENTIIENSSLSNSIVLSQSKIFSSTLANSIVGNYVSIYGKGNDKQEVSIGDYSVIH